MTTLPFPKVVDAGLSSLSSLSSAATVAAGFDSGGGSWAGSVVDSGVARVARYDAEHGISTLFFEGISRASADQRKGRAGRTAPGVSWRLWTESAHLNRPERNTPEIQRSDLAEVVLLLHSLGIKKAAEFNWLDKPDRQAVERAEDLLHTLGALKSGGPGISSSRVPASAPDEPIRNPQLETQHSDLTPIGRQMLRLPMHPRYSRMLVEAAERGCVPAAALCAALVSGRDLLMRVGRDDKDIGEARELFEASQDSDFFTLIRAFRFAQKNHFSVATCRRYGVHAQIAQQVEQTYDQIMQLAKRQGMLESPVANGVNPQTRTADQTAARSDDALLHCLLAGFIDQLCKRHDQGTLECDLTEGRHGTLMRESVVQNAPLFVTASIREVAGRGSEVTEPVASPDGADAYCWRSTVGQFGFRGQCEQDRRGELLWEASGKLAVVLQLAGWEKVHRFVDHAVVRIHSWTK